MVVTNLYPFEKISSDPKSTEAHCIENIDIGGPALIRGAAKNFESVAVLTSPDQYDNFIKEVEENYNNCGIKFTYYENHFIYCYPVFDY